MAQAARAHDLGDEQEALHQHVRAIALDRDPLPQLSPGAWQLKERGIEVAAVQIWNEVKAQAHEVSRIAQELSQKVRDWLERTAEQVGEIVDRTAAVDPWGDFFSQASAEGISDRLSRDLAVERANDLARQEADAKVQAETEPQHKPRDRDYGWEH